MTYEKYVANGWWASDYDMLSQWQRIRLLVWSWHKSAAPDKCIRFVALWDTDDLEHDWISTPDWWHPRQWHKWNFKIWQCQNFHHIDLGPMAILVAT